jgi:hypothetical protein
MRALDPAGERCIAGVLVGITSVVDHRRGWMDHHRSASDERTERHRNALNTHHSSGDALNDRGSNAT